MESTTQGVLILTMENFRNYERISVPPLCEIWNWEGDKSILPIKWSDALRSTFGIEIDDKTLKEKYSDNENFDPLGFFFVTYRSNTIGNCLVFKDENDLYWIRFLVAAKEYREKKLEEAMVGLAIEYMNTQKSDISTLYIKPFDDFQAEILKEIGFEDE